MKKNLFFLAFSLFLTLALLASCERDTQPVPAESGGATTTVTPGGPDSPVGFRTSCGAVTTECTITVDVTAGTPNYTVCGMVYSSGNDFCQIDLLTPCGEAKGYRETYTNDTTFCVDYVYHPGFLITNNNTTGNITVDVTSSGADQPGIVIGPGNSVGFEVDDDCDIILCQ